MNNQNEANPVVPERVAFAVGAALAVPLIASGIALASPEMAKGLKDALQLVGDTWRSAEKFLGTGPTCLSALALATLGVAVGGLRAYRSGAIIDRVPLGEKKTFVNTFQTFFREKQVLDTVVGGKSKFVFPFWKIYKGGNELMRDDREHVVRVVSEGLTVAGPSAKTGREVRLNFDLPAQLRYRVVDPRRTERIALKPQETLAGKLDGVFDSITSDIVELGTASEQMTPEGILDLKHTSFYRKMMSDILVRWKRMDTLSPDRQDALVENLRRQSERLAKRGKQTLARELELKADALDMLRAFPGISVTANYERPDVPEGVTQRIDDASADEVGIEFYGTQQKAQTAELLDATKRYLIGVGVNGAGGPMTLAGVGEIFDKLLMPFQEEKGSGGGNGKNNNGERESGSPPQPEAPTQAQQADELVTDDRIAQGLVTTRVAEQRWPQLFRRQRS